MKTLALLCVTLVGLGGRSVAQPQSSTRILTVHQTLKRCAHFHGFIAPHVRVRGYFVSAKPPSAGGQDGMLYESSASIGYSKPRVLKISLPVFVKERLGDIRDHSWIRLSGSLFCEQETPGVVVSYYRQLRAPKAQSREPISSGAESVTVAMGLLSQPTDAFAQVVPV